ncbi:serine/threonine kinase [Aureococcus anophagefferens]|nr:serine/threonine kinase [Aureococcus anophagefferens]
MDALHRSATTGDIGMRRRESTGGAWSAPFMKSLAGLGAAGLKLATSAPLGIVSDKAMYVEEAEIAVEKKRRRGKGLASATSAALTPPITRRHSFDVGELENRLTRPKLTMFHELRAYFDPEYRLHMVKRDILKFCRELDLGVEDMFNMVDEDGSGILDREEMTAMIKKLGILVKEVEIDTLMEKLDADGSGGIEVDEFDRWLFNTSDVWLERRRRAPDDEFSDKRLLERELLRFDPGVQTMLQRMWDLVDMDDSGAVDREEEYVRLNINLQQAVMDDFDPSEGRKIALREWEFDSQGCETMDKRLFFWSFFQLADAWRDGPDITGEAYVGFIDFLTDRATPEWAKKIEPMRVVEERRRTSLLSGKGSKYPATNPFDALMSKKEKEARDAAKLIDSLAPKVGKGVHLDGYEAGGEAIEAIEKKASAAEEAKKVAADGAKSPGKPEKKAAKKDDAKRKTVVDKKGKKDSKSKKAMKESKTKLDAAAAFGKAGRRGRRRRARGASDESSAGGGALDATSPLTGDGGDFASRAESTQETDSQLLTKFARTKEPQRLFFTYDARRESAVERGLFPPSDFTRVGAGLTWSSPAGGALGPYGDPAGARGAPVPQPLSAARQTTPVSRYRFPPSEGVPLARVQGKGRPSRPRRRRRSGAAARRARGPARRSRWGSAAELRKFRKGSVLDQGRRGGPAVGAATGRSSMFSKSTSSLGLGRFASVESAATPSYVAGGDEQQIWKRISSGKLSGPGYRNEAWAPLETKAPTRYARTQPAEQWSGSVPRLPPATKGAKSR